MKKEIKHPKKVKFNFKSPNYYLKQNKVYDIIGFDRKDGYYIINDFGEETYILLNNKRCAHLDGGKWEIVE